MSYVPIIDLDRDPDRVGAEIDDVCTHVGFFQIVGHGVPDATADRAWHTATAFFDLPLSDRMSATAPAPGSYGYSPFSAQSLGRSVDDRPPTDLREVFNAGPVDPPTHNFHDPYEAAAYSPTLWPDGLPEFRLAWTDYYRTMLHLGARLMSLVARGLGLPPHFFNDKIDHSPSVLRAINYPAQDHAPPGQLRAGAHTDYGTLTILRQDMVGGLEVLGQSATWVAVEPVPGAFVVNIGDLMARWTNDHWHSTMHRVVNPADDERASPAWQRRQSMPFFYNVNWSAEVSCLPTCLLPAAQPKYPPVVAGSYFIAKFQKSVIDTLRHG